MASTRILPTDPSYPSVLLALWAAAPPAGDPARPARRRRARALPGTPTPAGAPPTIAGTAGGPPTLYLRGALPAAPGIAIVGTRAASDEAVRFARKLARELAAGGFAIWSGGARGVDVAAHEGALDAGGPTVIVAGSGHDHPYPPEHAPLFERVLEGGGALLARVPDDAPPLPWHFLQRNAVLAAMTAATVVVEAGIESGARSTAAAARRFGRPLFAVPQAPWDPRGAGCALELARGARALTCARELLAVVGAPPPPTWRAREREATAAARPGPAGHAPDALDDLDLGADERAVLDILRGHPAHIDEICERSGLSPGAAARALLTLTLHAVVVEGPAGSYRRALR